MEELLFLHLAQLEVLVFHGDINGAPVTISTRSDVEDAFTLLDAKGVCNRRLESKEMMVLKRFLAKLPNLFYAAQPQTPSSESVLRV